MSLPSPTRGHGGGGTVTLRIPLALTVHERAELTRLHAVALRFQHRLADGLAGPAAFAVAQQVACHARVPLTYLQHLARAAATLRRQGAPVTPWTHLQLVSGGEHVRPIDPLRVHVAGLGEVRAEMFRLLCLDPRRMPVPLPGMSGLLQEQAALSVLDARRPGWPGGDAPILRRAALCPAQGGEWVLFATVDVPDLPGLAPRAGQTRGGLDIGIHPLAVLAREDRGTERMALAPTPIELADHTRSAHPASLNGRGAPDLAALTWRQALYQRGLATLSPLVQALPGLQRLSVERFDLQRPTDPVTRTFAARVRPYGLADVMAALPHWCLQSGTTLVRVDPSFSSQTCPDCGRAAVRTLARLHCAACGFAGDVHASAARVLLQRGNR